LLSLYPISGPSPHLTNSILQALQTAGRPPSTW
jgi:hypothetical protein